MAAAMLMGLALSQQVYLSVDGDNLCLVFDKKPAPELLDALRASKPQILWLQSQWLERVARILHRPAEWLLEHEVVPRKMPDNTGTQSLERLQKQLEHACSGIWLTTNQEVEVMYYIKSEQGYWLPSGYGYTKSKAEAGVFSLLDLEHLALDGCTLEAAEV